MEEARAHVAALINADPKEIVWTSGATEGNNLAIKGAANFYKTKGKHIITQKTEHKAVLDTCRELERQGFEVTYLEVEPTAWSISRGVRGGDPSRHHPRLDHDGEQRDRRDPAGVGDRRDLQEEGRDLPLRRGAGRRPHRDRHASSRRICSPSRRTRCMARKASARSTCGASRACASRRRSTAAATSAASAPGTLATHQIVGFGEAARLAKLEMATENERIRATG